MSNRNFDASLVGKRARDQTLSQQLYTSLITGKSTGNPVTGNRNVSVIATEYYSGVQTAFSRGTFGGVTPASLNIGGIGNIVGGEAARPPAAPAIIRILPGNGTATVEFAADADIIAYEYTVDGGNSWRPGIIGAPLNINGLIGGASYSVGVRVRGAGGTSPVSNIVDISGAVAPAAPSSLVGSAMAGSVSISFVAGDDGGLPNTYEYAINDGDFIASGSANPIVIDGLENGVTYSFKVRAVNAVGASPASAGVLITPGVDGPVLFLDGANYGEGPVWPESSGKSKDAALYGGVTGGEGVMQFSGSGQYAQIASETVDWSAGITVLAFANFGGAGSWERIIDFGNGSENNNILLARAGTGADLSFQIYRGSSYSLSVSLADGITDGQWNFYGARVNASNGTYRVFNKDSSISGATAVVPLTVQRTNNFIGRSNWTGDAYFEGEMGVLAIYNRPLSDAEIGAFYNLFKARYSLTSTVISAFTTVGSTSWVAPAGVTSVEYLVVAGGGGSGATHDGGAAGGGGGGMVLSGTVEVIPGSSYAVVVGDGGAGGIGYPSGISPRETAGISGEVSSFASIIALGGGGGNISRAGGAAGGMAASSPIAAGAGVASTGGGGGSFSSRGGGGGGSLGGGANGSSGGAGGGGTISNISGTSVIYGSGGAGGQPVVADNAAAGVANTGNGAKAPGTGYGSYRSGAKGGSGIVILKYTA